MSEQLNEQLSEQDEQAVQTHQKTAMPIKEVIAYLCEKFPLCFIAEGEAKPLKVGLFQELAEALAGDDKVSKTLLRQALRSYTMSWRYLHACRDGAVRVGLNGEEAGVVDSQQAEHAAQTLAQAKAAVAERRAAERKEQRKAQRKEFFKQKAREENAKKRTERHNAPKASLESLAALESKFSRK
ncbi:Protein proQ [Bibersteinia trehalosi USDA-ARS-USMARC-190]|uniref:RNA chaperone ProQ n=1 Tax=Bibersteinia trehalosi USDA-ARS-USMARC-190 TaxID=1263832 RepID=W0R6M3_BIBTR|nr:RNA chaperone ProQ [Bibersteinia trehalosi]AHG85940.1 Protein proQ [Bibersteinia trehalosi USDA-ARS-USMARC-190]